MFHRPHPILNNNSQNEGEQEQDLAQRIAKIRAHIFLQILAVLLFQDKCWSTVTPGVLHS